MAQRMSRRRRYFGSRSVRSAVRTVLNIIHARNAVNARTLTMLVAIILGTDAVTFVATKQIIAALPLRGVPIIAMNLLASTKRDGPDFSGPDNSWVLAAPCDPFSIDRDRSQSSYFCREAVPAFAPYRTRAQKDRAWTRRDSNPHLLPSQGAVFPLHHGPGESLLTLATN